MGTDLFEPIGSDLVASQSERSSFQSFDPLPPIGSQVDSYAAIPLTREALARQRATELSLGNISDLDEKTWADAWAEVRREPKKYLPFISMYANIKESAGLLRDTSAFKRGTATPEQEQRIRAFLADQSRPTSFGYKVGAIMRELLSFGVEFAASGGATKLLGEGLEKAGIKLAGEAAEKSALVAVGKYLAGTTKDDVAMLGIKKSIEKHGAWKTAGLVTGRAAAEAVPRTAFLSARAIDSHLQNMTPGFDLSQDDMGEIYATLNNNEDDFWPSLAKAYGDLGIEVFSEQIGEHLDIIKHVFGKSKAGGAVKQALLGRLAAENPSAVSRFLLGMTKRYKNVAPKLKRFGWNGLLGEIYEERVGDVARSVTGIQPLDQILPSFEDLLTETVAFAFNPLVVGGMAVDGVTGRVNFVEQERTRKIVEDSYDPYNRVDTTEGINARAQTLADEFENTTLDTYYKPLLDMLGPKARSVLQKIGLTRRKVGTIVDQLGFRGKRHLYEVWRMAEDAKKGSGVDAVRASLINQLGYVEVGSQEAVEKYRKGMDEGEITKGYHFGEGRKILIKFKDGRFETAKDLKEAYSELISTGQVAMVVPVGRSTSLEVDQLNWQEFEKSPQDYIKAQFPDATAEARQHLIEDLKLVRQSRQLEGLSIPIQLPGILVGTAADFQKTENAILGDEKSFEKNKKGEPLYYRAIGAANTDSSVSINATTARWNFREDILEHAAKRMEAKRLGRPWLQTRSLPEPWMDLATRIRLHVEGIRKRAKKGEISLNEQDKLYFDYLIGTEDGKRKGLGAMELVSKYLNAVHLGGAGTAREKIGKIDDRTYMPFRDLPGISELDGVAPDLEARVNSMLVEMLGEKLANKYAGRKLDFTKKDSPLKAEVRAGIQRGTGVPIARARELVAQEELTGREGVQLLRNVLYAKGKAGDARRKDFEQRALDALENADFSQSIPNFYEHARQADLRQFRLGALPAFDDDKRHARVSIPYKPFPESDPVFVTYDSQEQKWYFADTDTEIKEGKPPPSPQQVKRGILKFYDGLTDMARKETEASEQWQSELLASVSEPGDVVVEQDPDQPGLEGLRSRTLAQPVSQRRTAGSLVEGAPEGVVPSDLRESRTPADVIATGSQAQADFVDDAANEWMFETSDALREEQLPDGLVRVPLVGEEVRTVGQTEDSAFVISGTGTGERVVSQRERQEISHFEKLAPPGFEASLIFDQVNGTWEINGAPVRAAPGLYPNAVEIREGLLRAILNPRETTGRVRSTSNLPGTFIQPDEVSAEAQAGPRAAGPEAQELDDESVPGIDADMEREQGVSNPDDPKIYTQGGGTNDIEEGDRAQVIVPVGQTPAQHMTVIHALGGSALHEALPEEIRMGKGVVRVDKSTQLKGGPNVKKNANDSGLSRIGGMVKHESDGVIVVHGALAPETERVRGHMLARVVNQAADGPWANSRWDGDRGLDDVNSQTTVPMRTRGEARRPFLVIPEGMPFDMMRRAIFSFLAANGIKRLAIADTSYTESSTSDWLKRDFKRALVAAMQMRSAGIVESKTDAHRHASGLDYVEMTNSPEAWAGYEAARADRRNATEVRSVKLRDGSRQRVTLVDQIADTSQKEVMSDQSKAKQVSRVSVVRYPPVPDPDPEGRQTGQPLRASTVPRTAAEELWAESRDRAIWSRGARLRYTPAGRRAPTGTAGRTIEIVSSRGEYDESGMRGDQGRHMNSPGMEPGNQGWLGNPHKWEGNGGPAGTTVQDAIDAFRRDFMEKIENDPAFRAAVEGLRGKRIGYYRPGAPNHLQVVQEWLSDQHVPESYGDRVTQLAPNQVFVFGSNLDGFHGAGSAGFASFGPKGASARDKHYKKVGYVQKPDGWQGRWNVKGQGEGLQQGTDGQSYALPTVTKPGKKRSLTPEQITENIRKMYQTARENPGLEFLVAGAMGSPGLNGYTHEQMTGFYREAGPIPENVRFSDSYTAAIYGTEEAQEQTEGTPEFDKLPSAEQATEQAYAGVGSRDTPAWAQRLMEVIAKRFNARGFTLRSGGAKGADQAFERGAGAAKEIYVADDATGRTLAIAREIHPSPEAMDRAKNSGFAWKLMARNTNQVFGKNLDSPVRFVVAWTPDGAESWRQRSMQTGGTGQAIELASRKGIPVFNLYHPDALQRIAHFLNTGEYQPNAELQMMEQDAVAAARRAVEGPAPTDLSQFAEGWRQGGPLPFRREGVSEPTREARAARSLELMNQDRAAQGLPPIDPSDPFRVFQRNLRRYQQDQAETFSLYSDAYELLTQGQITSREKAALYHKWLRATLDGEPRFLGHIRREMSGRDRARKQEVLDELRGAMSGARVRTREARRPRNTRARTQELLEQGEFTFSLTVPEIPPATRVNWGEKDKALSMDEGCGICDITGPRTAQKLRDSGIPAKDTGYFKARSPIGDFLINHRASVANIDGVNVIVDQPQTEMIDMRQGPHDWMELDDVVGGFSPVDTHPDLRELNVAFMEGYGPMVLLEEVQHPEEEARGYMPSIGPLLENQKRLSDDRISGTYNGWEFEVSPEGYTYRLRKVEGELPYWTTGEFNPRIIPITRESLRKAYGSIDAMRFKDVQLDPVEQPEAEPPRNPPVPDRARTPEERQLDFDFSLVYLEAIPTENLILRSAGNRGIQRLLIQASRFGMTEAARTRIEAQALRREAGAMDPVRSKRDKSEPREHAAQRRALGKRALMALKFYIEGTDTIITDVEHVGRGRNDNFEIKGDETVSEIRDEYNAFHNDPGAFDRLADMYRKTMNEARIRANEWLQQLGVPEWIGYFDDYVKHLYDFSRVTKTREEAEALQRDLLKLAEEAASAQERKFPTYEDAARTKGWLPKNLDAADLIERWGKDVWKVAVRKYVLTNAVTVKGIDGDLEVIAIPEEEYSGDSAIPVGIYEQMAGDLARQAGLDLNPAMPVDAAIREMVSHYTPGDKGYIRLSSPFASIKEIWVKDGLSANVMKQIVQQPWDSSLAKKIERFNAWTKFAGLFYSLFYPASLLESGISAFGWRRFLSRPWEFVTELRKYWNMVQEDPGEFLEWFEHGVQAHIGHPDRSMGVVDQDLDYAIEVADQRWWAPFKGRLQAFRRFKQFWDTQLWNKFHPAIKLMTAENVLQEMERNFKQRGITYDRDELMDGIGRYVNNAFGGQEWAQYPWATPLTRQILHMVMFAPDWTISAANVAGITQAIPGIRQLVQAPISEVERDQMFRVYWPTMISLVLVGIPNAIQLAMYSMWGNPDEDAPFTFMNEEGKRTHIDMTPLLRKLGWVPIIGYEGGDTGKRRVYMRWGKQAYEVFEGWLTKPQSTFLNKTSVAVKTVMEQLTGLNTAGWELPFKGEGPLGLIYADRSIWKSRAGYVARKYVPMSILSVLDGRPSTFFAPASRGVSMGTAIDRMTRALDAYAEPSVWAEINGSAQRRRNLEELVQVTIDAAEKNGINAADAFQRAKSMVLGKYYKQFFRALNKRQEGKMDVAAEAVLRLQGKASGIEQSLKRWYRAGARELTPEDQALVEGSFMRTGLTPQP